MPQIEALQINLAVLLPAFLLIVFGILAALLLMAGSVAL